MGLLTAGLPLCLQSLAGNAYCVLTGAGPRFAKLKTRQLLRICLYHSAPGLAHLVV